MRISVILAGIGVATGATLFAVGYHAAADATPLPRWEHCGTPQAEPDCPPSSSTSMPPPESVPESSVPVSHPTSSAPTSAPTTVAPTTSTAPATTTTSTSVAPTTTTATTVAPVTSTSVPITVETTVPVLDTTAVPTPPAPVATTADVPAPTAPRCANGVLPNGECAPLPHTGASAIGGAFLALALAIAGTAAVLVTRRRTAADR